MLTFNDLGKYGRIGNQMFQIASTIGIATKMGYDYAFPAWKNYDEKERFSGSEDIDIQKWFKNHLPLIEPEFDLPEQAISWGYHNVQPKDNVSLKGHMQSERYFLHCRSLIKHYFTFKNDTKRRENTIAIHFRGGDYGGEYHPLCSREYYERAIAQFEGGFRLLLFTDDPERARERIPFEHELISGNKPLEDMEMMSKCDAHIISNSTFSWWGAWLAESRMVIAPARWFGPAAKLDASDIYPENWIVMI